MNQLSLAANDHEVSARRAEAFSAAADEIDRIDKVPASQLVKGAIGVAIDAINAAVGKNEKDARNIDERKLSLLSEAFADAFNIRIRNPVHLFNEVRVRVGRAEAVYGRKAEDRSKIAALNRSIAKKLCNGHADVWI